MFVVAAARRREVVDRRDARARTSESAGRSNRAPAGPSASVAKVRVEHVRRRRLRVAAGPLAAEPLVAALGLVASGQVPEVGHAAGQLPVVPVLRIGRVEVRARCRGTGTAATDRNGESMMSRARSAIAGRTGIAAPNTAPRRAGCSAARRDSSCSSTSSGCLDRPRCADR